MEIVKGGPKFNTERERDRERERDIERERERQTDRQTDTHTEAHFISLVFLRKGRNKTKK